MKPSTKAIIAVAGYGTRRLPITKTIEKCMLPLGDRPVVDYVVADCIKAGIKDIYFVVSSEDSQLKHFYSRDPDLEAYLVKQGKDDRLPLVMPPEDVTFHFVVQDRADERYGSAIPVWLCKEFIDEDELFAVVMGDDVTYVPNGESDIARMASLNKPAILGVTLDAHEDVSNYGVIAPTSDGHFSHIVEKPAAGNEPSRMINVSKYILPGSIMKEIDDYVASGPNQAGEYYIIDPINKIVADGAQIEIVEAKGKYLDAGSTKAWAAANTWLAEL